MPIDPNAIADKANHIYVTKYQKAYEADHRGEYAAIDVQSEEAVVAPTPEDALRAAKAKNESSMFHLIKIGSSGVIRVGYSAS